MPDSQPDVLSDGPARGVRVVVLGRSLPMDWGSMLLADLGAEVVMVEDPDADRFIDSAPPAIDGLGYRRLAFNRNKRSIALRIGDGEAAPILDGLLKWAGVVIFDSSEAVGRKVRARVAEVAARRSDVVILDGAPWGDFGLRAGETSDDLLLQAASGCMDVTGEADDPPTRAGVPVVDLAAGCYIAIAALAACVRHQMSGEGSRIGVAAYDAGICLLSNMASAYFATGQHKSRLGTGHISIFPYNSFRTSDGEIVIAIFTQAFWTKFCTGIDRPDLLENPRYASIPARMAARDELGAILDALFLERTTDEWSAILEKADVPYGPVLRVAQALALDQTSARGMTPSITGLSSDTKTIGSPMIFNYADGRTYRPPTRVAPRLGAHALDGIVASTASTRSVTR